MGSGGDRRILVGHSASFPAVLGGLALFLWRFVAFVAGVVALSLIYLKIRRLAPLVLAHWAMDIVATFMTMK